MLCLTYSESLSLFFFLAPDIFGLSVAQTVRVEQDKLFWQYKKLLPWKKFFRGSISGAEHINCSDSYQEQLEKSTGIMLLTRY